MRKNVETFTMDEIQEISFYSNKNGRMFSCKIKVIDNDKLRVYEIPYVQFNKDSSLSIIRQDDKDKVFSKDQTTRRFEDCIFKTLIRRLTLNLSGEILTNKNTSDDDGWFYETYEESIDSAKRTESRKIK